jgi:putative membrane protein
MRHISIALIAVLAGVVVLFKVQNLESATVSLFSLSATLPMSVLVLLVYLLGMLTGGPLLQLVCTSIRGAGARGD